MKSRFLPAFIACAALPLSGCGSSDSGPKSMDEAQEEAAKLDRPKPGQYKQVMTMTRLEFPDAPEMASQMKDALGQKHETEFCLTKEMAEQGFKDMFQEIGKDGDCTYDRFDVSGGKLDAVLSCQNETDGKGTITLAGNVTPEGSDLAMTIDTKNPGTPVGSSIVGMTLTTQRLGDCPAQPAQ